MSAWLGYGAQLFGQTLDVAVKVFVDTINIYSQLTCKVKEIALTLGEPQNQLKALRAKN